jgi:diguanylate cyclase
MRAARRKRTGEAYSGNLARLGEEAEGLRGELDRLRGDLDGLRHDSSHDRSERALDTNEQMLIAALHAQNIAVEALSDLREFTWWSERATDTAGLIARADAAMHVSKRRR